MDVPTAINLSKRTIRNLYEIEEQGYDMIS